MKKSFILLTLFFFVLFFGSAAADDKAYLINGYVEKGQPSWYDCFEVEKIVNEKSVIKKGVWMANDPEQAREITYESFPVSYRANLKRGNDILKSLSSPVTMEQVNDFNDFNLGYGCPVVVELSTGRDGTAFLYAREPYLPHFEN